MFSSLASLGLMKHMIWSVLWIFLASFVLSFTNLQWNTSTTGCMCFFQ